jgi:hypothetical protein
MLTNQYMNSKRSKPYSVNPDSATFVCVTQHVDRADDDPDSHKSRHLHLLLPDRQSNDAAASAAAAAAAATVQVNRNALFTASTTRAAGDGFQMHDDESANIHWTCWLRFIKRCTSFINSTLSVISVKKLFLGVWFLGNPGDMYDAFD